MFPVSRLTMIRPSCRVIKSNPMGRISSEAVMWSEFILLDPACH